MLNVNQLIGFGAGDSAPSGPHLVGQQVEARQGAAGGTFSLDFALTGGVAATPKAGDVVVIALVHTSNTNHDLSVSGYTEISDLYSNAGNDTNFGMYYKVMPSTPDTSVTLPYSNHEQNASAYAISVWRNIDQTTPLDVTRTTATGTGSMKANPPSITPTTPGAVIIAAGGGCSTGTAEYTSSNLTDFVTIISDDTYDSTIGMGYHIWESGAFDPALFGGGVANNANYSWAATTIALRPA